MARLGIKMSGPGASVKFILCVYNIRAIAYP